MNIEDIQTDGMIDAQKLLGTYNGVAAGVRADLFQLKLFLETNTVALDQPHSVAAYHWNNVDTAICKMDELDTHFTSYIHGR